MSSILLWWDHFMGERVANSAEWKLLDSLSVLLLCMFQQLLPFVLLSVSQASYDEPRLVYEYETLKVSSFAGKTHCGIIEEEFKLHEPHMVLGVKEFRFAIDPPTGVTLTTYMDTKRNQRAHFSRALGYVDVLVAYNNTRVWARGEGKDVLEDWEFFEEIFPLGDLTGDAIEKLKSLPIDNDGCLKAAKIILAHPHEGYVKYKGRAEWIWSFHRKNMVKMVEIVENFQRKIVKGTHEKDKWRNWKANLEEARRIKKNMKDVLNLLI